MERLVTYDGAEAEGPWREVAQDILTVPFWTPDFCKEVIKASDLLNEYRPLDGDVQRNAAPGQETRFNRISPRFAENFESHFNRRVAPIVRQHWWPLSLGKNRMPFVLKYSPDVQPSLDPHHDASMISMTIVLNDGYEGGLLTFPRQHWDSRGITTGTMVVFPGRVTHVHWVLPVTAGVRYSAAAWVVDPSTEPFDPIS